MKKRMRDYLGFRVDDFTREAVCQIADEEEKSMGDVARALLTEGLKARGLEA